MSADLGRTADLRGKNPSHSIRDASSATPSAHCHENRGNGRWAWQKERPLLDGAYYDTSIDNRR